MHHAVALKRTASAAALALGSAFGSVPAHALGVSLITLFAFQQRTAGIVQAYSFEIEVQGSDLVSVTVTPPGGTPIALSAGDSFFFGSPDYATPEALAVDFSEGSYRFEIAGSASSIAGTLDYAHSPTQGFVAIDAPQHMATVGPSPTFTITNGCTNCPLFIGEVADLASAGGQVSRETPFSFPLPPLFTPTQLTLSDLSEGTPLPSGLPTGSYEFRANGVSGSLLSDQALAGDASGVRFSYGFGDETSNRIEFSVPEPAEPALALAMVLALAALGRRGASRAGPARGCEPPAT